MKNIHLELLTQSEKWEVISEILLTKYQITPEDMSDLHYVYYATLKLVHESWK